MPHYPSSFLSSDKLDFLSICMNMDMDTSSLQVSVRTRRAVAAPPLP
jgi:hypothetical protein